MTITPEANYCLSSEFRSYAEKPLTDIMFIGVDASMNKVVLTRGEIVSQVYSAAAGLDKRGYAPGDVIILGLKNSIEQFCVFWAAQIMEITVGLVPPLETAKALNGFTGRLADLRRMTNARAIVLKNFEIPDNLQTAIPIVEVETLFVPGGKPQNFASGGADGTAVIQFTSGSTASPKGCALRNGAFVKNANWILEKLGAKSGDSLVSWLPTFHDMGLMSALILPIVGNMALSFRPSSSFLRNPLLWLEDLAAADRPHTAVPNFALALVNRQLSRKPDTFVDLSDVQNIACGAEPIYADTVRDFLLATARLNLSPKTFHSSYGMAEATLVVSSKPGGLRTGTSACHQHAERKTSIEKRGAEKNGFGKEIVCLGTPAGDVQCEVRRKNGEKCDDIEIGEIFVQSSAMMIGYIDEHGSLNRRRNNEWLATGDLGYIFQNEIYLTGRKKDVVIVAGRNIYPAEVESLLARALEIDPLRVAAFGRVSDQQQEELCILLEIKASSYPEALRRQIMRICMEQLSLSPDRILFARSGAISRTTSGKIRRHEISRQSVDGKLNLLNREASLDVQ